MNHDPAQSSRPTQADRPGQADHSTQDSRRAQADRSTRATRPTQADRIRQVVVTLSIVVAIIGAFIGSGALGGDSMPEAAGGAFASDSTPIAPAGPAFSIWSVIYAGLIAYTICQWFPKQSPADRHRRIGYWVAASGILNAAWLLAVQASLLWLTLVIMAALLAVLIVVFVTLQRTRHSGIVDVIVTDGTMGLYLGWIVVATAANVAAVLADSGLRVDAPDVWAVAVLAVAGLVGILLALWSHGRLAPSAAIAWGLAWVGVERLTGELLSTPAAITAFLASALVILVTIVARIAASRSVANGRTSGDSRTAATRGSGR